MNKFLKIIIATLGAVDIMFSIFIPIAVALLLVNNGNMSNVNSTLVLTIGLISSFYRAVKFWIIE